MTTLAIILAVITVLVAYTIYAVRRDERGDLPTPGSHSVDPRFLPPAHRR